MRRATYYILIFGLFYLAFVKNREPNLSMVSERYVRIETSSGNGSGFQIGENLVLTNFHVVADGLTTLQIGGKKVKYVHLFPEADLALFRAESLTPLPWITIADPELGETLCAYTNAASQNGFLVHHLVSKLDGRFADLQEQIIPGESGSGLVNKYGELTGITTQYVSVNVGANGIVHYGQAISGSALRDFLRGFPQSHKSGWFIRWLSRNYLLLLFAVAILVLDAGVGRFEKVRN